MSRLKFNQRSQQAINTRQKIYDTALNLFSKRGFEKVKVEDICKMIGVSKGTFYYYFPSKEQIILEKFKEIDLYHSKVFENFPPEYSSIDKLLDLCSKSLEFISDMGQPIVTVTYRAQIGPEKKLPYITSEKRALYTVINRIIEEGQETGDLPLNIDKSEMANLILRGLRGGIFDWLLHRGKFDLEQEGMKLISRILSGLVTKN